MSERRGGVAAAGPETAAAEHLLSVKEAAARCGLTPKAFVLRVYRGELPRDCVTAPIGDRVYIRAARLAALRTEADQPPAWPALAAP